jgi:dTMP kinase
MTARGTLIAIEGIDGSGKHTQVELLEKTLTSRGYSVYSTGFPKYDSWFGKMVGKFLNGELGPLDTVDPHFSALLYAGDRFEAKSALQSALDAGRVVLADRYIASNLAHQVARVPAESRSEFMTWIEHLEYGIYGLPPENLVLYLRVPPRHAQELVTRKSARAYTSAKQDILESSLRHLEDAAEMYDLLSHRPAWATIQCFDDTRNEMRPLEEIAADVLAAVEPVLAVHSAKGG